MRHAVIKPYCLTFIPNFTAGLIVNRINSILAGAKLTAKFDRMYLLLSSVPSEYSFYRSTMRLLMTFTLLGESIKTEVLFFRMYFIIVKIVSS